MRFLILALVFMKTRTFDRARHKYTTKMFARIHLHSLGRSGYCPLYNVDLVHCKLHIVHVGESLGGKRYFSLCIMQCIICIVNYTLAIVLVGADR